MAGGKFAGSGIRRNSEVLNQMEQKIGSWAFILGVIIAIITGILGPSIFAGASVYIPLVLVILGVIIGLLNISDKEITAFLVAVIALIAAGGVQWAVIPGIGVWIGGIFAYVAALLAPAAVIVGLKAVWNLAGNTKI